MAARRLDHAEQFFTPNYEFGFSKSADDTFTKWAHDQILGDYVRIIRYFRPEIIISRFTGTPRDGHGHHQVSGIITQEAFKVAADSNRFPEYGKPWQAKKLYLNRMGNDPNDPNNPNNPNNENNQDNQVGVGIDVGEFDSDLGRSYNEIAAEGRSMHRSQGQGGAQEDEGGQSSRAGHAGTRGGGVREGTGGNRNRPAAGVQREGFQDFRLQICD